MNYYSTSLIILLTLAITSCSNQGLRKEFAFENNDYSITVNDSTKNQLLSRKYFIEGKKAQSVADFAKAVEYFTSASLTEHSAVVYYNLAISYLNINSIDSAIFYFEKSISVDSLYEESYLYLTDILITNGKYSKAEYLNKILYKKVPSQANLMDLVNVQFYLDVNSAINNIKKGVELYKDNELNAYLSNVYLSLDNIDSANFYFEKYINNGRTELYVLDKLVQQFMNKMDYRICIKYLEYLKVNISDYTFSQLLDLLYSQIGAYLRIDKMLCGVIYSFVLNFEPISPYKDFLLGAIQLSAENENSADSLFNTISKYDNSKDSLITKVILSYYSLQKDLKAIKYLKNNISKVTINNELELGAISNLLFVNNKLDELIFLLKSPNTRFDSPKINNIIADSYLSKNIIDSAVKYYELCYLSDSTNLSIRNNLAYCLSLNNRNLKKALMLIQYSLNLQPENPNFLDTYGWINFLLGNVDIAYDSISKAAKYDSGNFDILLHLGYIYYHKGEVNNALLCWESAYQSTKTENLKIK